MRTIETGLIRLRMRRCVTGQSPGFSLVEMIVVMLVLSVLAVTVGLRWNATSTVLPYQAELLARNLRHAQMLAMTWGQNLQVVLVSPTNYRVNCAVPGVAVHCNGAGPITDPANNSGSFNLTLSNNATLAGPATLTFDRLGIPVNPATGAPLAVASNFVLSDGTVTWTARVNPITGFVTVSSP